MILIVLEWLAVIVIVYVMVASFLSTFDKMPGEF